MNVNTQCVLARACPFHLLVQSKWGKNYNQKSAYGDRKDGFFEYIANQQMNAKLEFSQGLFAVGTTEPYEALSLLENELYKLVYTDPKLVPQHRWCRGHLYSAIPLHYMASNRHCLLPFTDTTRPSPLYIAFKIEDTAPFRFIFNKDFEPV